MLGLTRKGDVNWTVIYLLILAAIAVILLISVLKPMFMSASSSVGTTGNILP